MGPVCAVTEGGNVDNYNKGLVGVINERMGPVGVVTGVFSKW